MSREAGTGPSGRYDGGPAGSALLDRNTVPDTPMAPRPAPSARGSLLGRPWRFVRDRVESARRSGDPLRDLPFPRCAAGLAVASLVVLIATAGVREMAGTAVVTSMWAERETAAAAVAAAGPGAVSFAVVDAGGRQVAAGNATAPVGAASTIKVIILAAYLNQSDVAGRDLTDAESASLRRMITASSNDDATRLLRAVGWPALEAMAQRAGIGEGFVPDRDYWGLTQVTAASLARLFHELPALLPDRHRAFALNLFGDVIAGQQWGMTYAVPQGWQWHIKGGWISEVVNQVGTFTHGGQQFTLAVTINGPPGTGASVSTAPETVPATHTIALIAEAFFGDGAIGGAEAPDCSAHPPAGQASWAGTLGCGRPAPAG